MIPLAILATSIAIALAGCGDEKDESSKPQADPKNNEGDPERLYCQEPPNGQGLDGLLAKSKFAEYSISEAPDGAQVCPARVFIEEDAVPHDEEPALALYAESQDRYCRQESRDLYERPTSECDVRQIFIVKSDSKAMREDAAGLYYPSGQMFFRMSDLQNYPPEMYRGFCEEPVIAHEMGHHVVRSTGVTPCPHLFEEGFANYSQWKIEESHIKKTRVVSQEVMDESGLEDISRGSTNTHSCWTGQAPDVCEPGDRRCCVENFETPFYFGDGVSLYLKGDDVLRLEGWYGGDIPIEYSFSYYPSRGGPAVECQDIHWQPLKGAKLCLFSGADSGDDMRLILTEPAAHSYSISCNASTASIMDAVYIENNLLESGPELFEYHTTYSEKPYTGELGKSGVTETTYCTLESFGVDGVRKIAKKYIESLNFPPVPEPVSIDGIAIMSEAAGMSYEDVESRLRTTFNLDTDAIKNIQVIPTCQPEGPPASSK